LFPEHRSFQRAFAAMHATPSQKGDTDPGHCLALACVTDKGRQWVEQPYSWMKESLVVTGWSRTGGRAMKTTLAVAATPIALSCEPSTSVRAPTPLAATK
jgi:hypothetical protein